MRAFLRLHCKFVRRIRLFPHSALFELCSKCAREYALFPKTLGTWGLGNSVGRKFVCNVPPVVAHGHDDLLCGTRRNTLFLCALYLLGARSKVLLTKGDPARNFVPGQRSYSVLRAEIGSRNWSVSTIFWSSAHCGDDVSAARRVAGRELGYRRYGLGDRAFGFIGATRPTPRRLV